MTLQLTSKKDRQYYYFKCLTGITGARGSKLRLWDDYLKTKGITVLEEIAKDPMKYYQKMTAKQLKNILNYKN